MTDKKSTSVNLTGAGIHDLPTVTNPSVMSRGRGEFIGIIGQVIHPETALPSDIYVRLTLATKDAMILLSTLQAVALDQGWDIPKTTTEIVESPADKKKH